MIKLKDLLAEDRSESIDRGCLMAMVPEHQRQKLEKFGRRLIRDENLYIEGDEYGRETDSHVTILYGFQPDLTEEQVREIIQDVKPFRISLTAIDKFANPKFDVVKFSVESPILRQLNEKARKFPHHSDFPDYKPHMTIAYVKPGMFKMTRGGMNITVPITDICYSGADKKKSYFKL